MAVGPDGGTRYAKAVADLYGQATADLLRVVARRLARDVDSPGWAEQKLTEVLALRREAQRVLASLAGASPTVIEAALTGAYSEALGAGIVATNRGAVAALARDLAGTLARGEPGVLRAVEDVYRSTVADTVGNLVTGAATRRQVAARALDRYAAQGVTSFVDTAGRRWQLDTYAEMTSRTAAGRAYLAGGLDRITGQGRDLVIVSDAPEECALCRPFEGKILSISGTPPAEPLPAGFTYRGSLEQARADGLFHPNCRHSVNAFVPGLTRPFGRTEDPEGDELRRRQRALERDVRESKRRVAAVGEFGHTPQLARQQALLKARQARLREFVAEHDRKAWVSAQRTQVRGMPGPLPGPGRSPRPTPRPGPPPAAARLGAPVGTPVHQALNLSRVRSPAVRTAIDHAGTQIARVHGDGVLEPLSVKSSTSKAYSGAYRSRGPASVDLAVSTAGPTPALTTVHEVGHWLDHQAIGQAGAFATENALNGLLAPWWKATQASSTYRTLQQLDVAAYPAASRAAIRRYRDYLLNPSETFARAYAQYVATRSGDRRLLDELGYLLEVQARDGVPRQWVGDDFEAVAAAFDDLMRRLGWRT